MVEVMKTIAILILMLGSTLAVGQISVAPKQVHDFSLQLMREVNLLRFSSMAGLRGEFSFNKTSLRYLSEYQIDLDAVVITGTFAKLAQLELRLRSYRRGEVTLAQVATALGLEDATGMAKLAELAALSDFIDTYTRADKYENLAAGDARQLAVDVAIIKERQLAFMQEISSNLDVEPAMVKKLAEVDNFYRDAATMEILPKVSKITALVEKAHADDEVGALAHALGIEVDRALEIVKQHQLAQRFYMIAAEQMSGEHTADTIAQKYEELLATYSALFDEKQLQRLKEFEQSVVETQVEGEEADTLVETQVEGEEADTLVETQVEGEEADTLVETQVEGEEADTLVETQVEAEDTDALRRELRGALVEFRFDDARELVARGANPTHALFELASSFGKREHKIRSNMVLSLSAKAAPLFLITKLDADPILAMELAVVTQDIPAVEFLLQFDIDLQQIDVDALIDRFGGTTVNTEAVAAIKAALQRGKVPERELELDPHSQLFYAALTNDSSAAAAALAAGAELFIALRMAVTHTLNEAAVRFLVDLDQGTENVLHLLLANVVHRGERDVAKFLVEELGADPTYVLLGAAQVGDREPALLLLELGADANRALQVIQRGNDTDAADFLVELGASAETPRTEQQHAADMQTVIGTRDNHTTVVVNSSDLPSASESAAAKLIAAVYRDATDEIGRILQKEELPVDVVIDNIAGTTLLHHAASEGKLKATTYLVQELGANLNIANSLNLTVLDVAVFFGHGQVAAFLIDSSAVSADTQAESGIGAAPTL